MASDLLKFSLPISSSLNASPLKLMITSNYLLKFCLSKFCERFICQSFPCQSFALYGKRPVKRKGLAPKTKISYGSHSFFTYHKIL